MLNRASRPLVKLVDKYLPDPYIFVLLLTLLVFAAAMLGQQKTPVEVLGYWGSGFWNLLSFSMQMLLVLVAGFMLASSAGEEAAGRHSVSGSQCAAGYHTCDLGLLGGQLA